VPQTQNVPTGRKNRPMEGVRVHVLFEDNTILTLTLAPGATIDDVLERRNDRRQGMPYMWESAGLGRL